MPAPGVKANLTSSSHSLTLRRVFALSCLIALLSGGLLLYRWPTTLTMAVGPANSPLVAYGKEIENALVETNSSFRVKIVVTEGSAASSKLLDQKKVDLAIVRSDDETSQTARSLVVLQRKTLFVIARAPLPPPAASTPARPVNVNAGTAKPPAAFATAPTVGSDDNNAEEGPAATPGKGATKKPGRKKIGALTKTGARKSAKAAAPEPGADNLLDLVGKSRGSLLSRLGTNDLPVFTDVLAHYGLADAAKHFNIINRKKSEAAFKANQIDLLVVLAHPSEPAIRSLVQSARKSLGKQFLLLAPPAPKGMAYQTKHLEVSTLPAGVFGGNPPIPAADLESVAVTYELVATTRIGDHSAAVFTKTLTDLRTQLRGSDDGEFAIELPSVEEPRRYLPHPGTVAQINGDSKTFLDQYSDLIWLALFGIGLVGSAITSLMGWLGIRGKPKFES